MGTILNFISTKDWSNSTETGGISTFNMMVIIIGQLSNAFSMQLKEMVVRKMPVNRSQFTFQVSLMQLVSGIGIMMLVLFISTSEDASN